MEITNGFIPKTLNEALAIRKNHTVIPYGGGTDLMVAHKPAGDFLFLHCISELKQITIDDTYICFGAACTFTETTNSPHCPPILREAIAQIAAPAIRNLGTLGGNIGNGSAKADSVLIFFALDAVLRLQSADNERMVSIHDFYLGRKKLDLKADELITEICIPKQIPNRHTYHKIGARAALAISRLSFAGLRSIENDKITAVQTAFGAIEDVIVRKPKVDQMLIGATVSDLENGLGDAYLKAYADALNPIDGRISAAYRKQVCMNLLGDFLDEVKRGA